MFEPVGAELNHHSEVSDAVTHRHISDINTLCLCTVPLLQTHREPGCLLGAVNDQIASNLSFYGLAASVTTI